MWQWNNSVPNVPDSRTGSAMVFILIKMRECKRDTFVPGNCNFDHLTSSSNIHGSVVVDHLMQDNVSLCMKQVLKHIIWCSAYLEVLHIFIFVYPWKYYASLCTWCNIFFKSWAHLVLTAIVYSWVYISTCIKLHELLCGDICNNFI